MMKENPSKCLFEASDLSLARSCSAILSSASRESIQLPRPWRPRSSCVAEAPVPLVTEELGPEPLRYLRRTVARAGVHYYYLVHYGPHSLHAPLEPPLLVLHYHAQDMEGIVYRRRKAFNISLQILVMERMRCA